MGILAALILGGSSGAVQRYKRKLVQIRQDEQVAQTANRQRFYDVSITNSKTR